MIPLADLKKYHVLACPDCGHMRTASSSGKTACPRCATSWSILREGKTVGVLGSFWTIHEARACLAEQQALLEERRAAARRLGAALSVLQLRPGCSSADFTQAYRARSLEAHPDQNGGDPACEERMRRINEAAECVRSIMGW